MRLQLIIDGIPHEIDSTDPDLLSRWIIEIFGRIPEINRDTLLELRAMPSFLYDAGGQWRPDWTADSRVISQITHIRSPRDLVKALGEQLDRAEALTDG